MRKCRLCGVEKELNQYVLRKTGEHRYACNACRAMQAAAGRYGITVGEILELRDSQNNRCAICGVHADDISHRSFKHNPLVIDHDHESGEVRGLLCPTCNSGLGHFKDNSDLLSAAAAYLLN